MQLAIPGVMRTRSIAVLALGMLVLAGCGSSTKMVTKTLTSTATQTQSPTTSPLEQGYLGAATVTIEPGLLEALPLPENDETGFPRTGVLVESVEPHSPAALAGLHGEEGSPYKDFGGDAITAADEMPVHSSSELGEIIASLKPGQAIPLTVARSFEEPRPGTQEDRFVYEAPVVVSVRLGVRPSTVPRVKSLGQDCGSAQADTQKSGYLHFFVTGSVDCDSAVAVVREYQERPERECGGNTCTIRLPNGWGCSRPEATGIVDECSSGNEKIAALETETSEHAPARTAEASIPAECGLPPLVQHPSTFAFSCDGNVVFMNVHWQHWGQATATGSGTLSELADGCTPDCASAPRNHYAARIVASQIVLCGPRRVYSTITAYLNERDARGQNVLSGPRFMTGSCG